ncbi:MAG: hypothetical protein V4732_11230 [Pseudomonadota bacterium]
MDRQVKNIMMVGSLVLLGVAGWQFQTANSKEARSTVAVPVAETPAAPIETASFNRNTFADIEARREQDLEDKRNASELAKQQNKKLKSVECLFWKQQKAHSSTANVDEKIEKFCKI